jgi:hypothetical protein
MVVVGIATGPCLWSVFKNTSAFGPPALEFYERLGGKGALGVRAQLLADLDDTFDFNADRVRWKTWRLRASLATLVLGLGATALLVAAA